MGDLLGSRIVAPFVVVLFSFESTDLSRFICCGPRMSPEHDKEKASKSGLPAMFPTDISWPLKSLQMPFFTSTQGRIAMLVRGDQGG